MHRFFGPRACKQGQVVLDILDDDLEPARRELTVRLACGPAGCRDVPDQIDGQDVGQRVLDRAGYFVRPTIVGAIPDDARLVREEQFDPVLPVLRYSDIDEVVARANDTEFGFGGPVWSSDRDPALWVASRIDSGTVPEKQALWPKFRRNTARSWPRSQAAEWPFPTAQSNAS